MSGCRHEEFGVFLGYHISAHVFRCRECRGEFTVFGKEPLDLPGPCTPPAEGCNIDEIAREAELDFNTALGQWGADFGTRLMFAYFPSAIRAEGMSHWAVEDGWITVTCKRIIHHMISPNETSPLD